MLTNESRRVITLHIMKSTNPITEIEIVGALALFLLTKTGSIFGKFEGRLSSSEQRNFFGCVPFGKCRVLIDGEKETVETWRKVAFGKDFEGDKVSWFEMEKRCRANRHPFTLGRYGVPFTTLPR